MNEMERTQKLTESLVVRVHWVWDKQPHSILEDGELAESVFILNQQLSAKWRARVWSECRSETEGHILGRQSLRWWRSHWESYWKLRLFYLLGLFHWDKTGTCPGTSRVFKGQDHHFYTYERRRKTFLFVEHKYGRLNKSVNGESLLSQQSISLQGGKL